MKWSLKGNIWELTKKKKKKKISEPGVSDIVNANKLLIELYGDLVDAVFAHFQDTEMNYNIDSHDQQKKRGFY